jgi:hypothetical protein
MSFELAEGYIDLTTKTSTFSSQMAGVKKTLAGLQQAFVELAAAASFGIMVKKITSFVEESSKAQAIVRRFGAVFDTQTASATKFVESYANGINECEHELMGLMASFQTTIIPLGLGSKEAELLSEKLTRLTEDMSIFYGEEKEGIAGSIISAIYGRAMALRSYGIYITDAKTNQMLLNMGIRGGVDAATDEQKVLARINVTLNEMARIQGTAEKSTKRYSGQLRGLKAILEDIRLAIGSAMIPAYTKLIAKMSEILKPVADWAEKHDVLVRNIILTTGAILGAIATIPLYISVVWVAQKAIMALRAAMIGLTVIMSFLAQNPLILLMTALAALAGYLAYTRLEGETFGEKMYTVAVWVAETWLWLKDILANMWAAILPIWNTAFAWIKNAFQVAGFVFRNFDDLATLGLLMATLAIVKFANDVKYWFTDAIPVYIKWLSENWVNIFVDMGMAILTILINLGKNLRDFFSAVVSWVKGDGFNFEWTGLLDGFKATTDKLPDIAKRQMTPFEDGLQKEIDRIGGELGNKFADEFGKVPDVTKQAEKATAPAQAASKATTATAAAGQQAMASSKKIEFVSSSEIWKKMAGSLTVKDTGKQQLTEAKKQTDELKKSNKHLEKMSQNTERKQGPATVGL